MQVVEHMSDEYMCTNIMKQNKTKQNLASPLLYYDDVNPVSIFFERRGRLRESASKKPIRMYRSFPYILVFLPSSL